MSERRIHPIEYLQTLNRRKWWALVTFGVCAALGVTLALVWPAVYRSSTVIGVQAPAVAPDLIAGRGVLGREERLRALSQQLRSPAVLERVVREEQLANGGSVEQAARDLNSRITVEPQKPIARTEGGPELNAFEITYRDGEPERTRRVAVRLADVFVNEHSRMIEAQAEGAAEFLQTQLRTSQQRIADLEARMRTIKERHMGSLPEQTPANLQTVTGMRQQLETTTSALRTSQDQLTLLNREIQAVEQGQYSAPSPAGSAPATPQQRLATAQRALAAAKALYTAKHPEVLILEEEVKAARAEVTAAGNQPAASRQEQLATDPAYQQRIAERNMLQLRIRELQRGQAQLQGDINRYQQRVDAAPMAEQELAETQREHELERENYKQLSERHTTAATQEQLARSRGGERFSVLTAAGLPQSPESPNRGRLILLSLALALALGLGAAFVREYLDRSIRDARSLQDEFDVPVLAEIPRLDRVA